MKIVIVFLGSLMILFFSCSSTHLIKQTQSDYSELNEKLQGEESDIIVNDGKIIEGRNIRIFGDSLYCIESSSDTEMVYHTSAIKEIFITQNTKGALEGAGIGALCGLGALGFVFFKTPETDRDLSSPHVAVFFLLPVSGALWGLPIGALIGHKETYVFEILPDSTKVR